MGCDLDLSGSTSSANGECVFLGFYIIHFVFVSFTHTIQFARKLLLATTDDYSLRCLFYISDICQNT